MTTITILDTYLYTIINSLQQERTIAMFIKTLSACPPYGKQLLTNYAFEQGLSGWTQSNTGLVKAAKLTFKGHSSALMGIKPSQTAYIQQKIALGSGCGLRLSVFLRRLTVRDNCVITLLTRFHNSRGQNIGLPVELKIPAPIIPTVYVPFFTEITMPKGATRVSVSLIKSGWGIMLVDNISLISVPPIA